MALIYSMFMLLALLCEENSPQLFFINLLGLRETGKQYVEV